MCQSLCDKIIPNIGLKGAVNGARPRINLPFVLPVS